MNPADDDYRLRPDSPCIDAGSKYYLVNLPEHDADGKCRLAGAQVDMGAYEFGAGTDTDGDLLSDADEAILGTNPMRSTATATACPTRPRWTAEHPPPYPTPPPG